jgi:hypothetical protein
MVHAAPLLALALLPALLLAGCLEGPPPPLPADGARAASCPDQPTVAYPFHHPGLREVSGLARSLHLPCLLWAHNDSGDGPRLFATDARGQHLGAFTLRGVGARDWEDLASFTHQGQPHLLVADVGNNLRDRAEVAFVVVPEPAPDAQGRYPAEVAGAWSVPVRYPAQPFDAEAVAVDAAGGQVLLVAKGRDGAERALYVAPLEPVMRREDVALQRLGPLHGLRDDLPGGPPGGGGSGAVTAMDLHPNGSAVAVLSYSAVHVWARSPNQTWAEAVQAAPLLVVLPQDLRQAEALAWSRDGAWLVVGDEQGSGTSRFLVLVAPDVAAP